MNDESATQRPADAEPPGRLSALAIVKSVLAAGFGVQSSKNRERDFSQGSYRHFIVAGIVFTVLFVLTLVMVVRVVLD